MQHFAHTVQGFFDQGDFLFYKVMVERAPQTGHFVEVGSYKGRSSSFLTVEIINSGKNIKLDCVDTWQGSEEHQEGQPFEDRDVVTGMLYETFLRNMKPVEGHYTAVRMASVPAAGQYQDNSLDMVFIDAAHDYDNVLADIKAWLPKVKSGGYMSGHDCNHPPIKQALQETIGKYETIGSCWFTQKS